MEQVDILRAVCLRGGTTGIHRTFTIQIHLWTKCSRMIGYIKRKMGTT